jgi:hypothetical protein
MIQELLPSCDEALALCARDDADLYRRAPEVSAWSVAQHLDHMARALRGCLASASHILEGKGEPAGAPNEKGRAILAARGIPRGRGQAPERTLPPERPEREEIQRLLASARDKAASLATREPELARTEGRVAHHDLGAFDAAEWLLFGCIHTRHHIELIDEILSAELA